MLIRPKTNGVEKDRHGHEHGRNRFAVIPTAEKLNAGRRYAGRGVAIAFLDAGFYPHPDYADRVIAFTDVSGAERSFGAVAEPGGGHWHGTQTVVSCAGNGRLSDGVYAGLAAEAELVLIKVAEEDGRIPDENIERGLEWVLENRESLGIRIVNMSLGGDRDTATAESRINRLAERLVREGVCLTVAAGNSDRNRSIPPASAPSVITVGGYSDENDFDIAAAALYHSSYGKTADGLLKPEIIAPAMYVAAPLLPGTEPYERAELLSLLAAAPDYAFREMLRERRGKTHLLPETVFAVPTETARLIVERELHARKIVATHYQHVDGTSFAAPIAASVIARMLEANPDLTPAVVKNILVATASRLAGFPAVRQGYGILNARLAVELARSERHFLNPENFGPPLIDGRRIIFTYHDDAAKTVHLAGDFNDWEPGHTEFEPCEDGIWRAVIPCQPAGRSYRYKLLVDGVRWIEDPSHGFKEDDGFGGFNSMLNII